MARPPPPLQTTFRFKGTDELRLDSRRGSDSVCAVDDDDDDNNNNAVDTVDAVDDKGRNESNYYR